MSQEISHFPKEMRLKMVLPTIDEVNESNFNDDK